MSEANVRLLEAALDTHNVKLPSYLLGLWRGAPLKTEPPFAVQRLAGGVRLEAFPRVATGLQADLTLPRRGIDLYEYGVLDSQARDLAYEVRPMLSSTLHPATPNAPLVEGHSAGRPDRNDYIHRLSRSKVLHPPSDLRKGIRPNSAREAAPIRLPKVRAALYQRNNADDR